ncbi:precorrin-2 C20-methyltransferase/precorrin-3B C17-methyltransferase [Williamsia limnetica]|uniref:Precorrin-2 C20-methyltransferase/precorrin-3B C17-methyltransferase n=1 Tax=Williamsia limnetica TaxID=882452 RepID=A0A318RTG2_WILLI|nr:precorrin-2 C(20)-methyltransferase [Williamsia limnetica]PYE20909.1 precorrin-2 C20-methyltransferase/precorrin-3B C17-methyltransferase [Williamsia limnetica]
MTGKLWGVGLGPGDSELVTVKAARIIGEVDVVAYHSARHGRSIARSVAAPYLRSGQIEEKLIYPVTTESTDHPGGYRGALADFYTAAAQTLAQHLSAGRSVALLAEGDPLFYSSYMHMHKRLVVDFDTEIIPGVTSVSASAAATGLPLVEADETLTVLPGTLSKEELVRRLRDSDAVAIMKLGRTFPDVVAALTESGRLEQAWYVERASTAAQKVIPVVDVEAETVPYFSMIVIPGELNNPLLSESSGGGGQVVVVGLGPGADRWTTPEVRGELAQATDLVGYKTYLNRVTPRPGQRLHPSDNKVESERACMALDLAKAGARVVVVSSGDPGVFAMAAAVIEEAADEQWREVPVRVVPGVTAANAVASLAGAPLGHDYAVISLSDRLKSWDVVAERVRAALRADLVLAIYNPGSASRTWQVAELKDILLEQIAGTTPVVLGRDVGGPEQSLVITTVSDLDPAGVDMRTLLIVGSTTTTVVDRVGGQAVFTNRRYGASPSTH